MVQKEQRNDDRGGDFPKELEIIKCREGNKEFMKERANKRSGRDQYTLVAEFPLYGKLDEAATRKIWRLAKRLARDFLRTGFHSAAIVAHMPPSRNTGRIHDCICVYSKYLLP